MNRKEFYEVIKNDFFEERTASFSDFKHMLRGAIPVFGTLETSIEEGENGKKTITFIDNDKADVVIGPKNVNIDEVNMDMSTIIMKLNLNKEGTIETVSHNIGGFYTPANKENVLLFASFIGKKITF